MQGYVTIDGTLYDVEYKVLQAEVEVRNYGDGSGYPGAKKEIEIDYAFVISSDEFKPGDNADDSVVDSIEKELIRMDG